MSTLYRKYRPQNFKEIFGQNHIKVTLQNEIEKNKLSHAYLFCGPRGIGKTTLARVFSKSVNCLNRKEGEHEPCNNCKSCEHILNGSNMDVYEIDAASHTGVDNVRENIISASRVMPSVSKYKVFIIDEVHMLSLSAFNALLKILEEPPKHVIFIMCTTEIHKVPATIISRCQRFDFRKLSFSDMLKRLQFIALKEKIEIDNAILEDIARAGEGHMRDAESIFGQIVAISGKKITKEDAYLVIPPSKISDSIKLIKLVAAKDAANAIVLVNKLVDEGVSLKNYLKESIELLRKILFAKISPALSAKLSLEVGDSLEAEIGEISKKLSEKDLILFIDLLIEAKNKIGSSFIEQMPIEIAVIKMASQESALTAPKNMDSLEPAPNLARTNSSVQAAAAKDNETVAEVKKIYTNSAVIALEDVLQKWSEILAKIKQQNHALSFIMKVCQPKSVAGNEVCLAFKYKFHKDRLDEAPIKTLVENILSEVFNAKLGFKAVIEENIVVPFAGGVNSASLDNQANTPHNNKSEDNNIVDNLLKTFGGKVVS